MKHYFNNKPRASGLLEVPVRQSPGVSFSECFALNRALLYLLWKNKNHHTAYILGS